MTAEVLGDQFLGSLLADSTLLAETSLPVAIHDTDGAVIEANQAFASLLGYTLAEAHQLRIAQILHPHDLESSHADGADLAAGRRRGVVAERRGLTKSGTVVWARVHKTLVSRAGRQVVVVMIDDVTGHRTRVAELEDVAYRDELTGVLNRRGLLAHLAATSATRGTLGVIMVDVNGLKDVNDRLGHRAGDLLLQSVARSMNGLGPGWVLARLAGDEFVLLAPGGTVTGVEDVVRAAVATPAVVAPDTTVVPSVAVGSARLHPGGSWAEAVDVADAAMYEDKRGWRAPQHRIVPMVPDYARTTGELLRRARTEMALTLRQVHVLSGGVWSTAELDSYERGGLELTVEALVHLAAFYGVAPAALLPHQDCDAVRRA